MTMKTELDKALADLGYMLTMHATDWMGHTWKYRVGPAHSGGPTNYFANISDLRDWILDVQIIRAMQADDDALLRRLQLSQHARKHPSEFSQNVERLFNIPDTIWG